MRKMRGMRGMRGMRKMRKRLLILNFEFCEKLPGGASAAGGETSAAGGFPDRGNWLSRWGFPTEPPPCGGSLRPWGVASGDWRWFPDKANFSRRILN